LKKGVEAGLICIIYLYCTIWGNRPGSCTKRDDRLD
jgi:hypothetical protein